MAFLRRWKSHYDYKHKKFKSDDEIAEINLKDEPVTEIAVAADNLKLDLNPLSDSIPLTENKNEKPTYNLKYLGCTDIQEERSKEAVASAIKTVINNSKAGGRKSQSHRRVCLNVSHDGLEVLDATSLDRIMGFSIYDISYCSVDAVHDHAFAFVGAEQDPLTGQCRLSCHVFECAKRKIANEITLMMASSFEQAYQRWRDTVVMNSNSSTVPKIAQQSQRNITVDAQLIEVHQSSSSDTIGEQQKNWISFDDEKQSANLITENEFHKFI